MRKTFMKFILNLFLLFSISPLAKAQSTCIEQLNISKPIKLALENIKTDDLDAHIAPEEQNKIYQELEVLEKTLQGQLALRSRLSPKVVLLQAIIKYKLNKDNENEIKLAIGLIESISVPLRREAIYNWHLAEMYFALGKYDVSQRLLMYIKNTNQTTNFRHTFYLAFVDRLIREKDSKTSFKPPEESVAAFFKVSNERLDSLDMENWGAYDQEI